jgi:hypothetical protein
MASTYSNLKIQLMTTGENTGTWGNVTNVNLGTALEEAITGSADVTFSNADVTLTLTDTNASQTARNLRLNLVGTVSAAKNLIVPAIEKIYLVNNNFSYAITVKNSTGSGIAVPAGKTMWVYNTGTNVVDALTHLSSLTLATALATSSGGTGSTSTTYCNLEANVTGTLPNGNTTATSANTVGAIVARDASGTFYANGANITGINANNVTLGTLSNSRTTASSSNGASTIIARNASGSFTANIMTGTATNVSVNNLGGSGAAYVALLGQSGLDNASQTPATYATLTYNTYDNLLETNINGNATTATTATSVSGSTSNGYGTRTVSTSAPTGGNNGDIWFQY